MLKASTDIQTLNTFSEGNIFHNLPFSNFQRRPFLGFVKFMFHGHGFRADLILKAPLANLANQQGNISIFYHSKHTKKIIQLFYFVKGETNRNTSDYDHLVSKSRTVTVLFNICLAGLLRVVSGWADIRYGFAKLVPLLSIEYLSRWRWTEEIKERQ